MLAKTMHFLIACFGIFVLSYYARRFTYDTAELRSPKHTADKDQTAHKIASERDNAPVGDKQVLDVQNTSAKAANASAVEAAKIARIHREAAAEAVRGVDQAMNMAEIVAAKEAVDQARVSASIAASEAVKMARFHKQSEDAAARATADHDSFEVVEKPAAETVAVTQAVAPHPAEEPTAAEQDDVGEVKQMLVKSHQAFLEAGMPDDRIDYILFKWVRSVFPETPGGDKLDCYYDQECHAKVDWEKISMIKSGFFAHLKMHREKDDVSAVQRIMVKAHEMFLDAGMPDDRIGYILEKWKRNIFGEALEVDTKDCYFDKECHAKVDWEKISLIKGGFFASLQMYTEKDNASAVKKMLVTMQEIPQEGLQSTTIRALPFVALLPIVVIGM